MIVLVICLLNELADFGDQDAGNKFQMLVFELFKAFIVRAYGI